MLYYNMAKSPSIAAHPYEIEYKGKIIRCRSLEDMEQALDRLESGRFTRDETPWATEEFQNLTGRIHVPQRRLLAKLLENGATAWVENVKLREVLDLSDNQALAGALSGISKTAQGLGIEPRRVYSQMTTYRHGKGIQYYQITSSFLQAAKKHNWPSKADLRNEE